MAWGFGSLGLVEGKWETTPKLSKHQSKPPIRGKLMNVVLGPWLHILQRRDKQSRL